MNRRRRTETAPGSTITSGRHLGNLPQPGPADIGIELVAAPFRVDPKRGHSRLAVRSLPSFPWSSVGGTTMAYAGAVDREDAHAQCPTKAQAGASPSPLARSWPSSGCAAVGLGRRMRQRTDGAHCNRIGSPSRSTASTVLRSTRDAGPSLARHDARVDASPLRFRSIEQAAQGWPPPFLTVGVLASGAAVSDGRLDDLDAQLGPALAASHRIWPVHERLEPVPPKSLCVCLRFP